MRCANIFILPAPRRAATTASAAPARPDFEQQECVNKAKALFRAAEEARRFTNAAKRGQ